MISKKKINFTQKLVYEDGCNYIDFPWNHTNVLSTFH
jgi:hypothetical protein